MRGYGVNEATAGTGQEGSTTNGGREDGDDGDARPRMGGLRAQERHSPGANARMRQGRDKAERA